MEFTASESLKPVPLSKIGYQCIPLFGDAVHRLKARLENQVGKLEEFNPENFVEKQVELMKKLHQMWEWKDILEDNSEFIKKMTGIEGLLYQKEPYLRIARTGRFEDNIGIHRDSHYGATDEEWVLWVPLTNAVSGGELRLLPGSHTKSDEFYPWIQLDNPEVPRGGDKHWLGFRYAPKKMGEDTEKQCVPVPCFVGEAILFNCACVHGQKVNKAPWTRFSIDIRLCDQKANVERSRGLHGEIYASLAAL